MKNSVLTYDAEKKQCACIFVIIYNMDMRREQKKKGRREIILWKWKEVKKYEMDESFQTIESQIINTRLCKLIV